MEMSSRMSSPKHSVEGGDGQHMYLKERKHFSPHTSSGSLLEDEQVDVELDSHSTFSDLDRRVNSFIRSDTSNEFLMDVSHDGHEGTATVMSATINFTNSIVGAGIIGLPFALKRTGAFAGLLLLAFVAFLTDYGARLLIISGVRAHKRGFAELCDHVFGKRGYYTVLVFMLSFALGGMIAYLIIIADTVPPVAKYLSPGSVFENRTFALSFSSIVFILPVSLLRNMAALASTSLFSLVAILVIVFTVAVRAPAVALEKGIQSTGEDFAFIKSTFFAGIGTMSFAFVSQHNSFIVFNSMAQPTIKRWTRVSHISVGSAWILCTIMAASGYFCFFAKSQSDILNNFSHEDSALNISRVLLALALMFTYPMEMFVARHCVLEALFQGRHTLKDHVIVTVILWTGTVMTALLLEDLGFVFELTGTFAASCIGYILPALCYMHVREKGSDDLRMAWEVLPSGEYKYEKCMDRIQMTLRCLGPRLMIAFGVVSMVAGTASAFYD